MSDPLSNCSTNTIILHDFGEIAYIVCTVSIPPPTHNAFQPPSPENNLARLRLTQKQFRDAAILAAIDPSSLQLFTFYKKVDVMSNQRAILEKFGKILKTNCCTIAYKAAARSPELFKPENARLYRLFVTAILASIRLDVVDNRSILPLGQRYHVIEPPPLCWDSTRDTLQTWTLIRTDMQMLLSGQVVITLSEQRAVTPLASAENKPQQIPSQASSASAMNPVVLAPSGQIAIFRNGWIGQLENGKAEPATLNRQQLAQAEYWQTLFTDWETERAYTTTASDDLWVELFIPVQEQSELEITESPQTKKPAIKTSMSLKSFFWPAKLCFALAVEHVQGHIKLEPDPNQDPVQFIIDWFEKLRDSDYGLQDSSINNDGADSDEAPVFPDDGPFDNPEAFQPFGPPTFPTGQTVYPTPPDGIMTHATPAMSAVDGLAATPSTAPRFAADMQMETPSQALPDTNGQSADNVDSSFYDDDLFDDLPDDNFGQESGAEEPNWDFFDKPGQGQEGNETNELQNGDAMDVDASEKKIDEGSSEVDLMATSKLPVLDQQDPRRTRHGSGLAEQLSPSGPIAGVKLPLNESMANIDGTNENGQVIEASASMTVTNGRRQSVFDAIAPSAPADTRDNRYSASGPFFFDGISRPSNPSNVQGLGQWLQRSPTPSTSGDDDTDDEYIEEMAVVPMDSKILVQEPIEDDVEMKDEKIDDELVDTASVHSDARIVFELVSVRHSRASLEDAVITGHPDALPSNLKSPGIRSQLASEVVRQLTQTCLLRENYGSQSLQLDRAHRNEITLSGGTLNEGSTYSSLSQLHSVTPPTSGKLPLGRTARLIEPNIALKRLDKQITARASILPFWDILGMQPITTAKDVSAFCIFAGLPGMRDSCSQFLDRMADAYSMCSLGQHRRGSLPGLTEDGLLEADAGDQGTFLGLMAKLGDILRQENQPGGASIFYVVALTESEQAFVYASLPAFGIRRKVAPHWATRTDRLDLAFQLVPPGFISSSNELVVPCQSDYNTLALGIFSQLPPQQSEPPFGTCDYPLILGDGRDHVHFGLDASTIWPLSPDSVLHVAYAFSEDRRWLLAVWTDSKGCLAFWTPYELKNFVLSPARPVDEVVKDIWTISAKLMERNRSKWRLVVAKAGNYEAPEINAWMSAANSQASDMKAAGKLILLSLELMPTFRIFPQTEQTKVSQQVYGTPASTPQGGVTSPEQMVAATPTPGGTNVLNAPTPPEHTFDANVDSDLSLIDPAEESWAVILPYGMNQAKDIMELRPAVASGYLVKRTGRGEDEGLTSIGVHMIWPTPDPAATALGQRERELEEYISDYRGLVTLAAARGCIDQTASCVPWHVHTAVSGATALGRLV